MMNGRSSVSQESLGVVEHDHTPYYKNNLKVLIVDDDSVILMLLSKCLENPKVEITEADNGQEAVDLMVAGAKFDLIVMDKEMPVMDGLEATRELRAMGVDCKIVGMSADDRENVEGDFLAAGVDEFLQKPVPLGKLVSFLREVDGTGDVNANGHRFSSRALRGV